jgi:glycerophosphoryl diester phosphodiesterase
VALGADCLELDVHLSADGKLVVIHDPTLDRTTDATGAVADLPLERIREADAGAAFTRDRVTFPYRGRGLRVPTLDEVLEEFPDTPLLIEIKTWRASAAARRLIEAHGAERRCIVDAFEARALHVFRGSRIPLGASSTDVKRILAPALVRRAARTLPYEVMCIPRWHRGVPLPVGALVRATRPAGCLVHVWTVNEPTAAQSLWALGVRGIVSDDPGLLLRARGEG